MCLSLFIGWFLVSMVGYEPVAAYNIPSSSMLPTLMVGDYVFALKGAFADRLPARGEVVVFLGPQGADYVKRVIGLPGDTVQLSDGILRVNGVEAGRTRLADFDTSLAGAKRPGSASQFLETLPSGARHPILEISDDGPLDDTPAYTVPAGHVFVLGDNRDNSDDSRASVGFVPVDHLLDRPLCIYWSRDRARIGRAVQ